MLHHLKLNSGSITTLCYITRIAKDFQSKATLREKCRNTDTFYATQLTSKIVRHTKDLWWCGSTGKYI